MLQHEAIRDAAVSTVNVDNEGIISTQIPLADEGQNIGFLYVSTSSYDNIHMRDNL